jgi:hypothetical protein
MTATRTLRHRAGRGLAAAALVAGILAFFPVRQARADLVPAPPPLAKSANVTVLGNLPIGGSFGINFSGNHAFVTGPDGLTVLDITQPANPSVVGFHPLPHFENEDVDVCGNVLVITNDREWEDLGSVLYVFDISNPTLPTLSSTLVLGGTGEGRGSGHIANFVKKDCSQVWMDGGDHVEVIDLKNPAAPKSLGKWLSVASDSDFNVTHDTERDAKGLLWSVGGGGAAAYQLTSNPLKPLLVASTSKDGANPSPYNDFIMHNSIRLGSVLYMTEEDYIDTDEEQPGSCNGQGKFETWSTKNMKPGGIVPLDTWQTELNSSDSKAPATVNCSSHWFEIAKDIAAIGWYEQGTRFIDVSNPKNIRQIGYYLPANGSTWAAYYVPTDPTKTIVYTADAYRGVDVLQISRKVLPGQMSTKVAPIPQKWFAAPVSTPFVPSGTWGTACLVLIDELTTA